MFIDLVHWLSPADSFASPHPLPQGTQSNNLSGRGATNILWIEVKDTAEHPAMHRTAQNEELGSLVPSAKAKKPASGVRVKGS